jgi:DNA replication and repair protein RecF
MWLKSIQLANWRNYEDASFVLVPGVNLIVGANAVGKTNILEAMVLLATTKSFRVSRERALIRDGADFAKVVGEVIEGDGLEKTDEKIVLETRLVGAEREVKKEIRINGVVVRALDVLGKLPLVYFSPEEIEWFFGWPERRRRWMNILLSMMDVNYAYQSAVYKKVLVNRNLILKALAGGRAKREELEFWDSKWVELAAAMIERRRELVGFVRQRLTAYFNDLFGGVGQLTLKYEESCTGEDLTMGLKEILVAAWERDYRLGATTVGPHREDLVFSLDRVRLDERGSRAQMRLALLSLKFCELDFWRERTKNQPVLVLDDIFSELDEGKREKLAVFFKRQQTIITTTDGQGVQADQLIRLPLEEYGKN